MHLVYGEMQFNARVAVPRYAKTDDSHRSTSVALHQ